jgi:hypothetical protein
MGQILFCFQAKKVGFNCNLLHTREHAPTHISEKNLGRSS